MANPYTIDPVAHPTLLGLAQQIMHRVTASASVRRARRQKKADAAVLEQMDPRLRDDIGVGSVDGRWKATASPGSIPWWWQSTSTPLPARAAEGRQSPRPSSQASSLLHLAPRRSLRAG